MQRRPFIVKNNLQIQNREFN